MRIYIGFITILIIMFFMTITIEIKVLKDKKNDKIILKFKTLLGALRYKIEIPFIDLTMKRNGIPFLKFDTEVKKSNNDQLMKEKKSIITIEEMKKIYDKIKYFLEKYYHVIKYIHKKVKLLDFLWITEFGTKDAAFTGVAAGFFWILQGHIIAIIKNKVGCKQMTLNVIPRFNEEVFKITFNCIISMKIGYIIIAAMKFGYTFLTKGGDRDG